MLSSKVFIGATTAQLGIETKFAEYFVGDFKTLNDFEDVYIGAKVTTPKVMSSLSHSMQSVSS